MHCTNHLEKYVEYSKEELLSITLKHVYSYLTQKVFGIPNQSKRDCLMLGSSNFIEYDKKALSNFMLNWLAYWDIWLVSGNQTKSLLVNDPVKRVKIRMLDNKGS